MPRQPGHTRYVASIRAPKPGFPTLGGELGRQAYSIHNQIAVQSNRQTPARPLCQRWEASHLIGANHGAALLDRLATGPVSSQYHLWITSRP